jgi:hypothetical protein
MLFHYTQSTKLISLFDYLLSSFPYGKLVVFWRQQFFLREDVEFMWSSGHVLKAGSFGDTVVFHSRPLWS